MRLSTKGRFAVTAMIDLGLRENAGPVSLADIAVRHQISLSYLEQVFSRLRQCALVESTRGPGGGYSLARSAAAISVADIIGAVEDKRSGGLAGEPRKADAAAAMTAELWATLSAQMVAHLQSISLQSLVSEQRAKGVQIESRPARRGVYKKPEPLRTTAPNSVFALGSTLLPSR
ncbi:MAG: Rrf2 family transcriptional regulator [Rhodoferax sp.]|nr:Rrf2 family transcriptional regulator [Rhodoferax sp.]